MPSSRLARRSFVTFSVLLLGLALAANSMSARLFPYRNEIFREPLRAVRTKVPRVGPHCPSVLGWHFQALSFGVLSMRELYFYKMPRCKRFQSGRIIFALDYRQQGPRTIRSLLFLPWESARKNLRSACLQARKKSRSSHAPTPRRHASMAPFDLVKSR